MKLSILFLTLIGFIFTPLATMADHHGGGDGEKKERSYDKDKKYDKDK